MKYIAILIEGDLANSLGGACSRDLWNLSQKIINDLPIEKDNIHLFFGHLETDSYATKIHQMGFHQIGHSELSEITDCFDHIVKISHETSEPLMIFFHYSGHGFQVADLDGDEIDGFDEALLDCQLTDDYIWDHLVSQLSDKTHLFALIDACHSGSAMDFPYRWVQGQWMLSKKKKIEAKCSGYSLSACNDAQLASQDVGETTGFAGSLTAGVCDCANLSEIINQPFQLYQILVPRLSKLHQMVELYSVRETA